MILTKKHIGKSCDFYGEGFRPINGRIEHVANGIARVRYWLIKPYNAEGYVTYLNRVQIAKIYD